MRSLTVLSFLLLSLNLFAQVDQKLPNGKLAYYGDEFYSKFPNVSKEVLFRILDSNHNSVKGKADTLSMTCIANCYSHTSIGYDSARVVLFGELFIKKNSNGTYVEDVYCGKKFFFKQVRDISNMGSIVNIEHTWPQSKFSTTFDKNKQKSDMHHLYPTDSDANNRRGNHSFGDVSSKPDELNVDGCSRSRLARVRDNVIFMPPVTHQGNVARSLFYFATRYKMVIGPSEEKILRQWHVSDPVDQAEKDRHEVIARYENVRNPFVDYPELVEKMLDF